VGRTWRNDGRELADGGRRTIFRAIRSLGRRVVEPEWLDASPVTSAQQNLRDIVRINRWFGGHRSLIQVLERLVRPTDQFSLLDVGAASGDMSKQIRKMYKNAFVVSLDHRILNLQPAAPPRVVAEAAVLPFRERSFDYVLCSLVPHHYRDECAVALIRELLRIPRQALIILDLDRHPVAYSFLPVTGWLFGWSELTIHDGCISVAAGFKARELFSIAELAGATRAVIRNHRPWFRISAVILPQLNDDADGSANEDILAGHVGPQFRYVVGTR
jgi:SAM-dependent methyltransferase